MPVVENDWSRLAALMRARRHELGLGQEDAVALGDKIGIASWRKLERGLPDNYTDRVLAAVARALRWTPDSIDTILAGGDPTPTDALSAPIEDRIAALESSVGVLVDRVDELIRLLIPSPGLRQQVRATPKQ